MQTPETPRTSATSYMPQLDGLRAICVLMVFVSHWYPPAMHLGVPWGTLGVDGFFVLSGFLITGILLGMREEAGAAPRPLGATIKVFMIRRGLRIFPAYFLVLAAMWILKDPSVRAYAPWCWTYTVNLRVFQLDHWVDAVSHLWSLALEEQFYLIWPFLILMVPWRKIPWILGAALLAGIFSRIGLVADDRSDIALIVFPSAALDFFAIGGLLAWIRRNHTNLWKSCVSQGGWVLLPLAALLGAGWLLKWQCDLWRVASPFGIAILWGAIIAYLADNGRHGKPLAWKPIVWIGQISYGLYLIHSFVPRSIERLCVKTNIATHWHSIPLEGRFAISMICTLLAAYASYYWIEKPILGLKKRWQ